MKNPTMLSFISLFLMAAWVTPACTKDVNQLLYVKDTVRITTHDTIRITTHDTLILGQDSVHANFVYTLSYQLPDSSGYEKISAENASLNAPLNAIYTWILDGNSIIVNNQTYFITDFTAISYNGNHILSMIITCPSTQKTFSVVKSFSIYLKG